MNLNDKNMNPPAYARPLSTTGDSIGSEMINHAQQGATLFDMYFAAAITGLAANFDNEMLRMSIKSNEPCEVLVDVASRISIQAISRRAELFMENQ